MLDSGMLLGRLDYSGEGLMESWSQPYAVFFAACMEACAAGKE